MKINFKDRVDLTFGAGGRMTQELINQLMLKEFDNQYLSQQSDQAVLPKPSGRLAFTTDSYVISPIFFNGGDIGSLAINGTVNDLAVSAARALYISVGFIIEEGFLLADLQKIVKSMAIAAKKADVMIVTGDTKVVEKGKGDGIYINTSGIGVIESQSWQSRQPEVGDKIIINGSIADHGMAIMAQRNGINFSNNIISDCAPINGLVEIINPYLDAIKIMRDPTRGGVSATLNEWAKFYQLSLTLDEKLILVKDNVRSLCELLGLDPLHVANEGKLMLICSSDKADAIVNTMKNHPLGIDSRIIGEVTSTNQSQVTMTTPFGGVRRIEWLSGEQLPRIC